MAETVHTHVTPPYRVNAWFGSVKFRDSWQVHAGSKALTIDAGQQGHLSNQNGQSVILAPMPRDELQTDIVLEAEAIKATIDSGQSGRTLRDTGTALTKPVESPTSSESTAPLWNEGKVFSGKIKF